MTPMQLTIVRAIRALRASGRDATPETIGKAVGRLPSTVDVELDDLAAAGWVTDAGFLGDSPRGVRLTGHGKALLERAEVSRCDQAGQ
jgi:DNA-binding MarR family transcriptional regulator